MHWRKCMSLPLWEHMPPRSASEIVFEAFTMVSASNSTRKTAKSGPFNSPIWKNNHYIFPSFFPHPLLSIHPTERHRTPASTKALARDYGYVCPPPEITQLPQSLLTHHYLATSAVILKPDVLVSHPCAFGGLALMAGSWAPKKMLGMEDKIS